VTAPLDAASSIAALGLQPHPEGGWYAETWRDVPADGGRGVGTAIYFLLDGDQMSHWHRVDATEIWPGDSSADTGGSRRASPRQGLGEQGTVLLGRLA
jgi:predicted cupin superfamily sugar epimerase